MQQSTIPPMCIVSGPADTMDLCAQALAREGFTVLLPHNHGLPSHPDPLTAAAAGAPNSGHTPGTYHPATLHFHNGDNGLEERENPLTEHIGSEYEHDPSIAFLAVSSDDPDVVQALVEPKGWILRLHSAPILHVAAPDPESDGLTIEQRLARAEQDLEIVRKAR